jgi:hypothetical protein
MIDINKGIDTIKKLLVKLESAVGKFIDAELKDGTKIKVDGEKIDIGAKVMVLTPEGEAEAPNGTHELSDGTKITTEAGIITEVIPAQPPKEEQQASDKFDAKPAIDDLVKRVAALEELQAANKNLAKENENLKAQLEASIQVQKETFKLVEQLAAQPAEQSQKKKAFEFSINKEDNLKNIIKELKTLKEK